MRVRSSPHRNECFVFCLNNSCSTKVKKNRETHTYFCWVFSILFIYNTYITINTHTHTPFLFVFHLFLIFVCFFAVQAIRDHTDQFLYRSVDHVSLVSNKESNPFTPHWTTHRYLESGNLTLNLLSLCRYITYRVTPESELKWRSIRGETFHS